MNYQKVYDELIKSAQSKNRIKSKECYYERHHIIPKCLGGKDVKQNLVLLTAREHYIAHKLLSKANPNNNSLLHAWHIMTIAKTESQVRQYNVSSKEYEIIRTKLSKIVSERMSKKVVSEETKRKISLANKGKKRTAEQSKRQSESQLGRVPWNKGQTGFKAAGRKTAEKNIGRIAWNKTLIYNNKKYKAIDLAKELNIEWNVFRQPGFYKASAQTEISPRFVKVGE